VDTRINIALLPVNSRNNQVLMLKLSLSIKAFVKCNCSSSFLGVSTWVVLCACACACAAEKWQWPDSAVASAVRIDNKVRFDDGHDMQPDRFVYGPRLAISPSYRWSSYHIARVNRNKDR
jgi:hypothetical protein